MNARKIVAAARIGLPLVVLYLLYRHSFGIWYREDDFPLVDFMRRQHSFREFMAVAFVPYAQGTVRPLSERLPFFLSLRYFGLNCIPLRVLAFATACIDLLLIGWIARRATGSRIAGFVAPTLWAVSAAIVSPLTWNASYNVVQYPAFLLGALALFALYCERGYWRFWWLQFAVFLTGFLSLENIVVYPAIAAAWCICFGGRGRKVRLAASTVPMFAASLAYAALHMRIAPVPKGGPYEFRIDGRIFATLAEYFQWALLSPGWADLGYPRSAGKAIFFVTAAALLVCGVAQLRKNSRTFWFCLAWFLVTLSLLLPLPNRRIEYYLATPVIGLCLLASSGVAVAWSAGWRWRFLAVLAPVVWCAGMLPVVLAETRQYVSQSRRSRALVLGVSSVRAAHPGKAILLNGIDDELYGLDFAENGMEAVGIDRVYLTSESMSGLHPNPGDSMIPRLVLDPAVSRHALENSTAVVYAWNGHGLANITASYADALRTKEPQIPDRVRVGDPVYSYLLGKDWGGIGNGVRWMPAEASLTIAGPDAPGESLSLTGYCIPEQFRHGPLHLTVFADGTQVGASDILPSETDFHRRFPLPDALVHRRSLELKIEICPVLIVGGQSFGALFGDIAIDRNR